MSRTFRSRALALATGPLALLAAAPAADAAHLRQIGGSLDSPVWVGAPSTGGLYAVQQGGQVMRYVRGRWTSFLDIHARVLAGGERGLLSVAFHPSYRSNRRFFVYYTRAGDGAITIAEYRANAAGTAGIASSGHVILTVPHPTNDNHNGGQLQFGPDGYLWAGTGDGGGGGDGPNNAQNRRVLLGKILRIDVNVAAPRRYGIPGTNPFASGAGGRREIWGLGVRNPWRFSFDRRTGDLWIGDVGQDAWEEVDLVRRASLNVQRPVRNFGWHRYEGLVGYTDPGSRAGLTFPIHVYAHSAGRDAITGGTVYRGKALPALRGRYVFGDSGSGEVFTLFRRSGRWVRTTYLHAGVPVAIGSDAAGELYVADITGHILRIIP